MAAKGGDKNIVEYLVDKEADIEIMDDTGVNTELISFSGFSMQPQNLHNLHFVDSHFYIYIYAHALLLDHVEPKTGSSNDFHLISSHLRKGPVPSFIHEQL